MADPFVAEIRMFPFDFAPTGWAQCDGQLLPIAQNTALFSLIGTFYGGNGTSNFALPNLQGCCAVAQGQGPGLSPYEVGQTGGEATHTLLLTEIPAHTHVLNVSNTAATLGSNDGTDAIGASATPAFGPAGNTVPMGATTGGSEPHNNLQPYLTINFCIALQGIFPSRS